MTAGMPTKLDIDLVMQLGHHLVIIWLDTRTPESPAK
jgi:hypothetical protein